MTSVAGLLLAAGQGSRLGRPKALVEVGGRRLADRAVGTLREAGLAPIVVVSGAAPIDLPGVLVAHNPDWATGMGSSLRTGLVALPDDAGAVVVSLVDQPGVGPEAVRRLVAAYEAGAEVAVATYDGEPRNPVLLARTHWPAVAESATGDRGARAYLRAHPDLVTPVECADVASADDIDTPADLDRYTGG